MPAETPQEFGEELRREREIREVSREELAAATKVSVRQIEALEAGRFDLLPARVFSRGFVQAIAQHVGLDPERTGAAFVHVHTVWSQGEGERKAAPISGTHPRLSRPRKRATLDTTALGVGIAIALASVAAVVTVVRSRGAARPDGQGPRAVATQVPEPTAGPAILSLPPAIAEASVALPSGSTLSTSTSKVVVPAAQQQGGRTLTLTFREDCWTEVSVDGKVVAAELCRKGSTREFSGAQKFILTLGNAGGVDLRFDGVALKSLGEPGQVVRNLVVDETLLPGRTAGG